MSQLFTSGGQSIGISASASVLSMSSRGDNESDRTEWLSELNDIEEAGSLLACVLSYVQLFVVP